MPRISTYIDNPITLGRGQVGSANLRDGSVYHSKFAGGTGQHGSLDLRRAVGTITTVDVGSFITSYGSAGTFATRIVRAAYGSYKGTVQAPKLFGRYGSFTGTIQAPNTRGAYGSHTRHAGSIYAGAMGSFRRARIQGTITANQGSFTRLTGSLGSSRIYGTQRLTRIPRQLTGFGTVSGAVGSFTRSVIANLTGAGTVSARYGSTGTLAGQIVRGRVGSYQRLAGSLGATRITHGTFNPQRYRVDLERALNQRTGTILIGSVKPPGSNPQDVTFDPMGRLWYVDSVFRRVDILGTLPLRAGTNSRFGTTKIGSFNTPDNTPSGAHFNPRGEFWLTGDTANYVYRIGTIGLRAGTNSRFGTLQIGSFKSPSTGPRGIATSTRGDLWLADGAANRIYRIGTLPLRGGTKSRQGTTLIGSFTSPASDLRELTFSQRGHLWTVDRTTRKIYTIGTLAQRNGTNTRLGTYNLGSIRGPDPGATGIAFDQRGILWHAGDNGVYIWQLGTTPGTIHHTSRVIDNIYGKQGSFTGTIRSSYIIAPRAQIGTLAMGTRVSTRKMHIRVVGANIQNVLPLVEQVNDGDNQVYFRLRRTAPQYNFPNAGGGLVVEEGRSTGATPTAGTLGIMQWLLTQVGGANALSEWQVLMNLGGTGVSQLRTLLRGRGDGTFNLNGIMTGGTVPSTRILTGTIAGARRYQSLGSHLNGSIAAGGAAIRYAVWPVAFPNANYIPVLTVQARGTVGFTQLTYSTLTRTAGSVKYYIGNTGLVAVSIPPPGSVFVTGLAA